MDPYDVRFTEIRRLHDAYWDALRNIRSTQAETKAAHQPLIAAEMKRLVSQGISMPEIADQCAVSRVTAWRWLKGGDGG